MLQSPPKFVAPHVPLPMVPTGGGFGPGPGGGGGGGGGEPGLRSTSLVKGWYTGQPPVAGFGQLGPGLVQSAHRWSQSQLVYQLQSFHPSDQLAKLAILQPLSLATQASSVFMPGKEPLGAVLQSGPTTVGPQVPLPVVPTGGSGGGGGGAALTTSVWYG